MNFSVSITSPSAIRVPSVALLSCFSPLPNVFNYFFYLYMGKLAPISSGPSSGLSSSSVVSLAAESRVAPLYRISSLNSEYYSRNPDPIFLVEV